ncbi:hypothetical protein PR003_g32121 [Phytophthora rubi]|uniref:RNase H type-1 domain-containing protein n=1 Tax=Phytophthora rubi TaxID=129364 RepID=A0A6A4B1J7_9STRA|nr:hypothetical protein PR003_g32121 [Phytophthora rubi]
MSTRRPPKAVPLRGSYWKTRRAADAAAVVSWTYQHRDQNRAAAGFACMAQATEQSVEWKFHDMAIPRAKWAAITDNIQADVEQWITARAQSTLSEDATDKV